VSPVSPGSVDPFTRLGIDPRFGLDIAVLDARQRELGRSLHPDRHASAPPAQRRRVLNEAMDVNKAYRELRDPVLRCEALLERLGVGAERARERRESPAFLMEVLEQREALAEARTARDLGRVRQLEQRVRAERATIEQALTTLFDEGELARELVLPGGEPRPLDNAVLGRVLDLLGRLRYVRRFLDEVASIEDEIG
jgi:molecular chaperone HscB